MHLSTDSSDLAAAGYFNGAWFIVPFAYEFEELKHSSGTCRSEDIMFLVRKLLYICAKFNFELSVQYINSHANDLADSMSRLHLDRFHLLAPNADRHMTVYVFLP